VDIFPGLGENGMSWWATWLADNGLKSPEPVMPGVVFSEACYGAHIDGRSADQAISLTFLRAGSSSFVGSTCIAYGAIAMPLTAADLLGHTFWQLLMDGHPAGEALRRAKVYLSTEMDRRQGYLDGEDQKTLISFVLYGDPLYQDAGRRGSGAAMRAPKHHYFATEGQSFSENIEAALAGGLNPAQGPVHTVCDRAESSPGAGSEAMPANGAGGSEAIPPEVLANVRQIVSKYLPGMTGADMKLAAERADCQAHGHTCPTAHLGAKAAPPAAPHPDRKVVTLSKSITCPVNEAGEGQPGAATITHQQFARLTLDGSSNLVKLVVSR
jgi:hypothetical protein